jgi:hypothetical protein
MRIKRGDTRVVLLIGSFAFKFPRYTTQRFFLQGCIDNISERVFYKTSERYGIALKHKLSVSLFCSWFGFIQIQKRCLPLNRELQNIEKEYFKGVTTDQKSDNFGIYNGVIVCLDYA